MCFFILTAVPKGDAAFEERFPRSLAALSCTNPAIARHLPPGLQTHAIVSGICSCGLFGRELLTGQAVQHADRLRLKYRKKGWSEARAARALAQARRAAARSLAQQQQDFVGLRDDVRELLAGAAEESGELIVLIHFFDGQVETEKFEISGERVIDVQTLREGKPPIQENQLVHVQSKTKDRSRGRVRDMGDA
jgi:hypothetical protein